MITLACVFGGFSVAAFGCASEAAPEEQVGEVASAHHADCVPRAKIRRLTQKGDALPTRSGHQVVAVKDNVYVVRGLLDDYGTQTNTFRHDVLKLDPKPQQGRVHVKELHDRGEQRPTDLAQHCSVGNDRQGGEILSFGGATYIFQGDPNFFPSFQVFDNLWRYRVSNGKWSLIEPEGARPSARVGCHAEMHDGSMYVFGGMNRFFAVNNELWRFDVDAETWTQLTPTGPVPPPRYLGDTVVDPDTGKIYLFGGHHFTDTGESSIADFWVYDIASNTWEQLPNVLPVRDEGKLSVLRTPHGKKYLVYALGHSPTSVQCTGFPLQVTSVNEVWAFDLGTQTWHNLDIVGEQPRIQFVRGAKVDNRFYLVGGWDDAPDPVNTCKQVFNEDVYELSLID